MQIESHHSSAAGRKGINQDAVLETFISNEMCWAAIADGIGGKLGGDQASSLAIEAVRVAIEADPTLSAADVAKRAKERLDIAAASQENLQEMGTTLTILRINGAYAQVAHTGDTRIYHLRNEGILSRTVDQTEVQSLLDQGILSKPEAKRYPRRNVLLNYLSPVKDLELYIQDFEVESKDRLVLLTDGVYKILNKRKIREISLDSKNTRHFVQEVSDYIHNIGPVDDYTICAVDILAI